MQPDLKKTETILWKLITAPEGVKKAPPHLIKPSTGDPAGRPYLTSEQRIDIYANMYFYRIRDSLKEDFPAILNFIGEINFHNLITDYLIKHPPTHFSLRYAGGHLPKFLKNHRLIKKFPFLADLARLEWAILDSFDSPDSALLTQEALQKIKPDQWPSLHFKLVPSFQLIKFDWPVDQVHRAGIQKKPVKKTRPEKCTLRIWRQDHKIYFRKVDRLEEKTLKAILAKKTFAQLGELAARALPPQKAVPFLASVIQMGLNDGLFQDLSA